MRSIDPDAGMPAYESGPHPSLRIRAAGIRFEPVIDGFLLAWLRLCDGQWRGLVSVHLSSANKRTHVDTTLYVRRDAIRPKATVQEESL
ncbi:hypothetical protein [Gordonia sp. (in: high G+C Gram-positive bacteria)]|uniref:hypothetical protein n=1 Tax=Gordonia sp. (in: high G+C Gram-positive bacteria) TaxID=84139 RepID=UPI003F9D2B2D